MKQLILIGGIFLLSSITLNAFGNEDFITEQRSDFDTLSKADIKETRQHIIQMADEVLARLYKDKPEVKEKLENAYGYGVFEGQAVNLIMYVAGNGLGVVYDNKTKTPVFMNAVRAGTGPGIGYKSIHAVVIFDNEIVFKQFTNIGLQVSASGDASLKIAGKGLGKGDTMSLVPGISLYQLTDIGVILQANWGATEFLKDPNLNQ